jgi:predicted Zn-dependent peptidase
MLAMGKSYLLRNRFDTLEQIIEDIEETSADTLLEIANEVFDPSRLSQLTFMPK